MRKTVRHATHSKFNKLLPLSGNEAAQLQAINIKTISHLYETNYLGNLQNIPNSTIDGHLIGNPELIEKLKLLRQALNRMHLSFSDKPFGRSCSRVTLARRDNLSRLYRKTNRTIKDANLRTAPAYHT
jgi:hypothetical protein